MEAQQGQGVDARVLSQAEQLTSQGVSEPEWCRGRLATAVALGLYRQSDSASARRMTEGALVGDLLPLERARWLSLQGILLADSADLEGAVEVWKEELLITGPTQDPRLISTAHGNLAEALLQLNRQVDAAHHQQASLQIGMQWGMRPVVAFSLIIAARLRARQDAWADAVLLHSAADRIMDDLGMAMHEQDQELSNEMVREAKRVLDSDQFESCALRGRQLGLPEAIEMALGVLESIKKGELMPNLALKSAPPTSDRVGSS